MVDVFESVQFGRAAMRLNSDAIIEHLKANPESILHQKVAQQLEVGVGGKDLVENYGSILEALNGDVLANLFHKFPAPKMHLVQVEAQGTPLEPIIESVMSDKVKRYVEQNTPAGWWEQGNTLALMDLLRKTASFQGSEATLNSCLIGAARRIGLSEDRIREAFTSDRNLTIYEP